MKRSLSTLTEKELRNLISTLCSANSENALLVKLYLNDNSVLDSFEKKIEKALDPDRFSFREAKHYLSAIKKFCTDPQSVAELFVFAAETGNDITMEYGDIDENYYCSMENLFEASCKLVKNLPLNWASISFTQGFSQNGRTIPRKFLNFGQKNPARAGKGRLAGCIKFGFDAY